MEIKPLLVLKKVLVLSLHEEKPLLFREAAKFVIFFKTYFYSFPCEKQFHRLLVENCLQIYTPFKINQI